MCRAQLIFVVTLAVVCDTFTPRSAWSHESPSIAHETTDEVAGGSNPGDDTASTKANESEDPHAIAIEAMDLMIETWKGCGNAKAVADTQDFRDQFPGDDEVTSTFVVAQNLHKLVYKLLARTELLAAEKLVPTLLRFGEALKKEHPTVFIAAHQEAGRLDMAFERYDSALKHISIALKVAEEEPLELRELSMIQSDLAAALCKLKRYDEAEQIYLDLIQQCAENTATFSEDDLLFARYALADFYRQSGDYRKCLKLMPSGQDEDDDSYFKRYRDFTLGINTVNLAMSEDETLEMAADFGQRVIEETQEYFGVSSREHIEALEVMARVCTKQEKYNDAVAMLNKSASLRARLLGKDHPSVTRVRTEISSAVAKQLEKPIWESSTTSETETPDRYGEVKY